MICYWVLNLGRTYVQRQTHPLTDSGEHCRNPNGEGAEGRSSDLVGWPDYTPKRKEYIILESNKSRVDYGHRDRQCAFWREYIPKLKDVLTGKRSVATRCLYSHCDLYL